MDALNAHGLTTKIVHLNEDIETDDVTAFQVYGIYPFSFDRTLKTLKADGKRIIYDLDDALGLIDTTNPFYHSVIKDAGSEREILKYADHITVATKALADYARPKTSVPITVIPNMYNPNEWTFKRPTREGIRIGFAGSSTHVSDLLEVLPAIKNLQAKHDIKFLIMGFGKDTFEAWLKDFKFVTPAEGMESVEKLDALLKDVKYEWIPYVDFDLYPSTLINMSLDFGLCPLKNSPFNNCRSSSKAMEYTLAGALALASDVEAYRNDPTSILVKDNNWETTIEYYIENPDTRMARIKEHLKWIKDNRNVNSPDNIALLKSVYQ